MAAAPWPPASTPEGRSDWQLLPRKIGLLRVSRRRTFTLANTPPVTTRRAGVATIDTVTDSGEAQTAKPETAQSAEPAAAATPTVAPFIHPTSAPQRSMTLVVSVFGAIITALLGGMFLFMVSAIDGLRSEVGSLRAEMNARFTEVDRKFDQVNAVLMDHTGRLARIETTLDVDN